MTCVVRPGVLIVDTLRSDLHYSALMRRMNLPE
jgi:hypothetical protein